MSKGKVSNEMVKVIASSLRDLERTGRLVLTNDQQFVDVSVEGNKLVIRLKDK